MTIVFIPVGNSVYLSCTNLPIQKATLFLTPLRIKASRIPVCDVISKALSQYGQPNALYGIRIANDEFEISTRVGSGLDFLEAFLLCELISVVFVCPESAPSFFKPFFRYRRCHLARAPFPYD